MARPRGIPTYRRHKQSGQAVVTLTDSSGSRRDVLLGKYGSAESRAEYARVIAEWETAGRCLTSTPTSDLTVNELLVRYWQWAEQYYRDEHGARGRELENVRLAVRPLRRLFGTTVAKAFGPLALRTVQQELVQAGLSRGVVNARINRVRRVFKWAVSYELIPPHVYEALRTVPGLKRGRCEARETAPVQPVSDEQVNATLPFLPDPVRAMVELQRLTGCRPGEVMVMRAIDLNMSGPIWIYRPSCHKSKYRGLDRVIFLGPQAQEVVKPFLTTNLEAYLFSPRAYVEAMHARRAAERKTKRTPSQLARKRKTNPKRKPAERYNRRSYYVAVWRACDRAFPSPEHLAPRLFDGGKRERQKAWWTRLTSEEKAEVQTWRRQNRWHPNQLRHSAATAIRARYGVEAAKVVLGHTKVETTQIYAERDQLKAAEIMAEIG